jgi:hypothetical protein
MEQRAGARVHVSPRALTNSESVLAPSDVTVDSRVDLPRSKGVAALKADSFPLVSRWSLLRTSPYDKTVYLRAGK